MRNAIAIAFLAPLISGCGGEGHDPDVGATGVTANLSTISRTETPSKRSEILSGVHEPTNSILIFGGNDGPIIDQFPNPHFRNDTWVFEPGVGWAEVPGDGPRRRGRYSLSVDETGNRALLYGGRFRQQDVGGDYTLYGDLWSFDFLSREWTQLDNGNNGPPARYYPGSAWVPGEQALYIWGGLTNTNPLQFRVDTALWKWTADDGWSELETTGTPPSPRGFFGATHDTARNELVIFGGQEGNLISQAYHDMFALNLDSREWRELHDGNSNPVPSTRMHSHITYDEANDQYILFGGHTDEGDLNDLWTMDPEVQSWKRYYIADKITGERFGCLEIDSEVPADYVDMDLSAPERRHRGGYALMYDNLWLFGGIHAECSEHLDDTWRFEMATETWHELIEATSGESCARRGDDCACLCI